jgi:hypothetical protein
MEKECSEIPMLTAAEIRVRVQRAPFVPFRVVSSSGRMYDVPHPEMILVGRREVVIGRPSSDDPTIYEAKDILSVLHITALEDIVSPSSPSRNGEAQSGQNQ